MQTPHFQANARDVLTRARLNALKPSVVAAFERLSRAIAADDCRLALRFALAGLKRVDGVECAFIERHGAGVETRTLEVLDAIGGVLARHREITRVDPEAFNRVYWAHRMSAALKGIVRTLRSIHAVVLDLQSELTRLEGRAN